MKNIYLLEAADGDWRGVALVEAENETQAHDIVAERHPLSKFAHTGVFYPEIQKLTPTDNGFLFSFEKWSDEIAKLNEYQERIKELEELLSQYEANY
jgi:hypothetical protein